VPLTLVRKSEPELDRAPATELPAAPGGRPPLRQATTTVRRRPPIDIVEEWGIQSFPASDPPANW